MNVSPLKPDPTTATSTDEDADDDALDAEIDDDADIVALNAVAGNERRVTRMRRRDSRPVTVAVALYFIKSEE
jgi:hypothetical protein